MTRYEDDESSSYPMTPQQARHNDRRRAADDIYITNSRDPYQPSEWLQREKAKSSKWRKIFLAVAIIIVAAIAGILAWYYAVHKKNQDNETIGKGSGINVGSGGPDKNGDGSGTVAKGDTVVGPNGDLFPNPNYKLKRVFYGMAYVPMSAQLPNCGATPESVAGELQLLAMSTRRVRLYGTDCNVLDYTLQAIKTHKLDLKVIIGIWIDNKNETFIRQEASMFESLKKHGWDNIIGISVGNEVIFDNYQPLPVLIEHIKQVKDKVVALGHPDVPVFTSDLLSAVKPPITNNEDIAGVNLHPFFSGINIEGAADWFWRYYNDNVIRDMFIDTWLCKANELKLPYYFFEFFDAPWKIWPGSPVEGFWGIMTIDKKLKVKLPDCLAD
ncbi:hypothetical protein BGW41_005188 [Actinomortierella wolfii]|nr:hypothetical protein BGW41_005188 [Actinomortierella wolfii]